MNNDEQNRIFRSAGYRWEKITQEWLDDNDDFETRPGWHLYAPNGRGEVSVGQALREIEIGVDAAARERRDREIAEFNAQCARADAARERRRISEVIQKYGTRPENEQPDGICLLDTQDIYGGGDWFVAAPDQLTVWYVKNNGMDGDNWSNNNVRTGGAGAIGWKMETVPNTDPDTVPALIRILFRLAREAK